MKLSSKINKKIGVILFTVLGIININSYAGDVNQAKSPIGTWRTIDDKTNKPKSIVKIYKKNNKLAGRVNEILYLDDGGDPETKRCDQCTGKNKNKLIKGMTILWDLKQDGDEWVDGNILDPKTGSIYSAKLYLDETGDKLNVRGYLGFSLLGRTQVWERVK